MNRLDHPMIRAYLARLDAVSVSLPPDRSAELHADIEEHLLAATVDSGSDETVRAVLARLGEPEDLVAVAAEETTPAMPPAPFPEGGDSHRVETAALVLLVAATVAPLTVVLAVVAPLPWLAGLVLLFVSRRWSVADKVWGTVAYGLFGAPFVMFSFLGAGPASFSESCSGGTRADGTSWETCTGGPPDWWPAVLVAVGLGLLGLWVYTGIRLARHARRPAGPAVPPEKASIPERVTDTSPALD